jgi:Asp/Glu/hydantoin racemase
MEKRLALIHTSFVFLNVETSLMKMLSEALPDVKLLNILDDTLLADVMREGKVTSEITRRICYLVLAAEHAGVSAIFSLCSSVGEAIDVAKKLSNIPILKIDEAMAEKAVSAAGRIGVLATVPTTLGPTVRLIQAKANEAGKTVITGEVLCDGAFQILMSGDREKHDKMIKEKAVSVANEFDLLVFAQASMARLESAISEATRRPVLSSPRLGVQRVKTLMKSL